jgi:hypothetical protein
MALPEVNKRILWPRYKSSVVRCRICGKRRKSINSTHLKSHGYLGPHPVEDYKREYHLDKATATAVRYKIGKQKLGNDYFKGRKNNTTTKTLIASAHKGLKASPETRKKLSKQRIGNKNALGMKHSEAFKKRISEYNKVWWADRKAKYGKVGQGGKPLRSHL